jgi:hypothetical protein
MTNRGMLYCAMTIPREIEEAIRIGNDLLFVWLRRCFIQGMMLSVQV